MPVTIDRRPLDGHVDAHDNKENIKPTSPTSPNGNHTGVQRSEHQDGDVDCVDEAAAAGFTVSRNPNSYGRRLKGSHCASLYSGSRFVGEQKSGINTYKVEVDLQHVDLSSSFLCGSLRIHNLTSEHPSLTTFFDCEIIGPKHSFLTSKWDATPQHDIDHWAKFPAFQNIASTSAYDYHSSDYIFMRWKEHFLLPNHRVTSISGASFAGFYYICYCKSTGTVDGFYFHQNSEMYQKLVLEHVPERTFDAFEFR
ncbi:vacuolar import and degradation protein-domain-containing protein [Gaertneriomyces semiglobifer]|nr:vacuolar import and degradation protein-domain-containing protein [Gaertneriomyces semiglobifer]